ncbi:MAG: LacI family transcriptional regulator [Lachnospiraceae bacterium]|nr:LacI family transcriptional regulator [Lachnospiraceae bacterium]
MNQKEIIIGLIINDISDDYSKDIVNGVLHAIPQNKNIHLVTMPGKSVSFEYQSREIYEYHFLRNAIYDLGYIGRIDGLIVPMGSLDWMTEKKQVIEFLDQFGKIPKVLIASDYPEYITVNYDNESGIREAVNCLINVNGMRKICMLGGKDDNMDARERKRIYIKCLEENGIAFEERFYEKTDMSGHSEEAAQRLLDHNPDVEAIFCVNDLTAAGLYKVMEKRGLHPGDDIKVFGFDNTLLAAQMNPPLTSIGAESMALGKKAMELLIDAVNRREVQSALVPTRLHGRYSLSYEMYEYSVKELIEVNEAFIYRMFHDCFYRYDDRNQNSEDIKLDRLFFEIILRMLRASRDRYMTMEDFQEVNRMVDVFFENGAMEYTDVERFLICIGRLQGRLNHIHKAGYVAGLINRMFLRMKDNALKAIAECGIRQEYETIRQRKNLEEIYFRQMQGMVSGRVDRKDVFRNIHKFGIENGMIYLFEEPVRYEYGFKFRYPDHVNLKCTIKSGEVYLLPKERQRRTIRDIFSENEMFPRCKGIVVLPIFYGKEVYGLLICEHIGNICDRGEFVAGQLSAALKIAEKEENS